MCLPTKTRTQNQPKRKRPNITYLLLGPLIGGLLTHLWDLSILHRRSLSIFRTHSPAAQDFLYAAEIAPHLLRHKRHVNLQGHYYTSWSDGVDRLQLLDPDPDRYWRHESPDNEGECIPMHSWQERSFPTCNSMHEVDFFSKYRPDGEVVHITRGGFNELYEYKEHTVDTNNDVSKNNTEESSSTTSLALKILKYDKEYTSHKFGVVRQDSVTLERLTKSSNVYAIYGYCGFSMMTQFFTGGTLDDRLRLWRYGEVEISPRTRLQYAVDMARALRDLHDIDGDGVPSATHGDLKEQQYLFGEDGRLMLGDFNKGQFLTKSSTTSKPCTYKPPSSSYNDKVFRSPEEYKNIQQTASTDVYALGSLIYYLITKQRVWEGMHDKKGQVKARELIVRGKKPKIDSKIRKSKDPVIVALLKAYEMCTAYEPEKRATAEEVSEFLESVWNDIM